MHYGGSTVIVDSALSEPEAMLSFAFKGNHHSLFSGESVANKGLIKVYSRKVVICC
jgi:hypothetical protein